MFRLTKIFPHTVQGGLANVWSALVAEAMDAIHHVSYFDGMDRIALETYSLVLKNVVTSNALGLSENCVLVKELRSSVFLILLSFDNCDDDLISTHDSVASSAFTCS